MLAIPLCFYAAVHASYRHLFT